MSISKHFICGQDHLDSGQTPRQLFLTSVFLSVVSCYHCSSGSCDSGTDFCNSMRSCSASFFLLSSFSRSSSSSLFLSALSSSSSLCENSSQNNETNLAHFWQATIRQRQQFAPICNTSLTPVKRRQTKYTSPFRSQCPTCVALANAAAEPSRHISVGNPQEIDHRLPRRLQNALMDYNFADSSLERRWKRNVLFPCNYFWCSTKPDGNIAATGKFFLFSELLSSAARRQLVQDPEQTRV